MLKNTPVPRERTGFSQTMRPMKRSMGRRILKTLAASIFQPSHQVAIKSMKHRPTSTGNQPPCSSLARQEPNSEPSTHQKSRAGASDLARGQCQTRLVMRNNISEVMSMSAVTAMPYAVVRFSDSLKTRVSVRAATSIMALISGM